MEEQTKLDTRRIAIFMAIAFGISWATALGIFLTGGLPDANNVQASDHSRFITVLLLTAGVYMMAPALAHVLTRLLTREGFRDVPFRPRLKQSWPYWLIAWVGPALLTIAGVVIYYLIFPGQFDPHMSAINIAGPSGAPSTPPLLSFMLVLQAIMISPAANGLFTFGEEFGWRGYLLHKLMPLGGRRAVLVLGIIWGVWHWPMIAMGHNYGLAYAGAPWLGLLAMTWFTMVTGIFLSWITLRSGSFWPAVIGHAAINGIAGLGAMYLKGTSNLVLGPTVAGVIGVLGFAAAAAYIYYLPGQLDPFREKLAAIPSKSAKKTKATPKP